LSCYPPYDTVYRHYGLFPERMLLDIALIAFKPAIGQGVQSAHIYGGEAPLQAGGQETGNS